jgi:hypothetical protein
VVGGVDGADDADPDAVGAAGANDAPAWPPAASFESAVAFDRTDSARARLPASSVAWLVPAHPTTTSVTSTPSEIRILRMPVETTRPAFWFPR